MKNNISLITLLVFLPIVLPAMEHNKPASASPLTAAEVARIKHDMYRVHVHEMGLKADFLDMAHGNATLAHDLKEIYDTNDHYEDVMRTFKALCRKWNLDTSQLDADAAKKQAVTNLESTTTTSPLSASDQQALVTQIKKDNYLRFRREMGILDLNFLDMAHGNADLAKDIEEIYYKSRNHEIANQKLAAFCEKWHMQNVADEEDTSSDEEDEK